MTVEEVSFYRIVLLAVFFNVKDRGSEARCRTKEQREGMITTRVRKTKKRLTSVRRHNPPAANSVAPLPPLTSVCKASTND
jgi:hypothetical protein